MEESPTFSKRKEKKFLVNFDQIQELKKLIQDKKTKFLPDHLAKDTKFTSIENIYFDAPNFSSYHDSILKSVGRFKMRIRSYSQNDVSEDRVFIEIKAKDEGETLKKRVAFKRSWLDKFISDGYYPIDEFISLNEGKKLKKLKEHIKYISHLIINLGYAPVLKSSYVRYAYKIKSSNTVRITIDDELKFTPLMDHYPLEIPYKESFGANQYIVEIKYVDKGGLEEISDIMQILGEPAKFSKYCFGVYRLHQAHLPVTESREIPINQVTLPHAQLI